VDCGLLRIILLATDIPSPTPSRASAPKGDTVIDSVDKPPIHELLSQNTNTVFNVPAYQREYSWRKEQWDALFDDLIEEEPDSGHFLGTIICVNRTTNSTDKTILELVDGQQRMTTISLLLLALYKRLLPYAEPTSMTMEQQADFIGLKRMLVLQKNSQPRLTPQRQNRNGADYLYVLREAGLVEDAPANTYVGVRRIAKALNHFLDRITTHVDESDTSELETLLDLVGRVQRAVLVKLEVQSTADAFTLFESLNNRGLPLTPIDLIKTSVLSQAESELDNGLEQAYKSWSSWLQHLTDDYATQERFFRQFYNGFRTVWNFAIRGENLATRSRLIRIYESLVQTDLRGLMARLDEAAPGYARLIGNLPAEHKSNEYDHALEDLGRVQGAPSYLLLLVLSTQREVWRRGDSDLAKVTELLTRFFVRRNLTNTPSTNLLDRLFMSIVEELHESGGVDVYATIHTALRRASSSTDEFARRLSGPIYEENTAVTRFILVSLARSAMTNEITTDLWTRITVGQEKSQYLWTIEHILPQGENLPVAWVDMLGGAENAARVQGEDAHRLGNLTITGYNSTLGNLPFDKKRDRVDKNGKYVGYRNGLSLNEELKDRDHWGEAEIEARTEALVREALVLFEF